MSSSFYIHLYLSVLHLPHFSEQFRFFPNFFLLLLDIYTNTILWTEFVVFLRVCFCLHTNESISDLTDKLLRMKTHQIALLDTSFLWRFSLPLFSSLIRLALQPRLSCGDDGYHKTSSTMNTTTIDYYSPRRSLLFRTAVSVCSSVSLRCHFLESWCQSIAVYFL